MVDSSFLPSTGDDEGRNKSGSSRIQTLELIVRENTDIPYSTVLRKVRESAGKFPVRKLGRRYYGYREEILRALIPPKTPSENAPHVNGHRPPNQ